MTVTSEPFESCEQGRINDELDELFIRGSSSQHASAEEHNVKQESPGIQKVHELTALLGSNFANRRLCRQPLQYPVFVVLVESTERWRRGLLLYEACQVAQFVRISSNRKSVKVTRFGLLSKKFA